MRTVDLNTHEVSAKERPWGIQHISYYFLYVPLSFVICQVLAKEKPEPVHVSAEFCVRLNSIREASVACGDLMELIESAIATVGNDEDGGRRMFH